MIPTQPEWSTDLALSDSTLTKSLVGNSERNSPNLSAFSGRKREAQGGKRTCPSLAMTQCQSPGQGPFMFDPCGPCLWLQRNAERWRNLGRSDGGLGKKQRRNDGQDESGWFLITPASLRGHDPLPQDHFQTCTGPVLPTPTTAWLLWKGLMHSSP